MIALIVLLSQNLICLVCSEDVCEETDFSIAFFPAVLLIVSGLQKPSAKCQKQACLCSPGVLSFFVQLVCDILSPCFRAALKTLTERPSV